MESIDVSDRVGAEPNHHPISDLRVSTKFSGHAGVFGNQAPVYSEAADTHVKNAATVVIHADGGFTNYGLHDYRLRANEMPPPRVIIERPAARL